MDLQQSKLISLRDASRITPYSQDYLGLLVRKRKLFGEKIEGKLFTTEEAVKGYLRRAAEASYEHQKKLNVEIPAEEMGKIEVNLKWSFAFLVFVALLILVGGMIYGKIQDDKRSESIQKKYVISEDQNGNVTILTDDPSQVKSVEVKKKNKR